MLLRVLAAGLHQIALVFRRFVFAVSLYSLERIVSELHSVNKAEPLRIDLTVSQAYSCWF